MCKSLALNLVAIVNEVRTKLFINLIILDKNLMLVKIIRDVYLKKILNDAVFVTLSEILPR